MTRFLLMLFVTSAAADALANERPAAVIEVAAGEDYSAKLARLGPGDELRFCPASTKGTPWCRSAARRIGPLRSAG
jgi:hypothetical protein